MVYHDINHGINYQRPQLVLNHQTATYHPNQKPTRKPTNFHSGNQLFEANGRDSELTAPDLFLRADGAFWRDGFVDGLRVQWFSNVAEPPSFGRRDHNYSVFGDVFELLCGHQ